jgi:hypothetical protein
VRNDYGPAGVRVELGHVGILPVWEENNRNELAAGRAKTPVIRPILIDREIPLLEARLDELNKVAGLGPSSSAAPVGSASTEAVPAAKAAPDQVSAALSADQKREFIEVTNRLKLLTDRRAQILARTGDEYVIAPPKLPSKP